MSDAGPQLDEQTAEPVETVPENGRRSTRIVGLALIIVAVVLGWLLLVGYLGYQSGQQELVQTQQDAYLDQLERQLALAQENMDVGSYDLALVRLEWILEREPNHPEAQRLKEETQQLLTQSGLATAVPTAEQVEVTATVVVEPSPTPGQIGSPEEELQRIRRLLVRKEWQNSVTSLVKFQLQFPNYERQETDALLFDAYLGASQELLDGPQVELGLYYLDQAEKLGSLPQSMQDYRLWADLYTQGISFYGANWDAAAYYFRDLCLAAPFYQDACTKLHKALVSYGDQNAAIQEWCPAQQLYQEAWRQNSTAEVSDKLAGARAGCLSATATPDGTITGTLPISGTVPITSTQPLSGTDSLPAAPVILPSATP